MKEHFPPAASPSKAKELDRAIKGSKHPVRKPKEQKDNYLDEIRENRLGGEQGRTRRGIKSVVASPLPESSRPLRIDYS